MWFYRFGFNLKIVRVVLNEVVSFAVDFYFWSAADLC